MTNYLEAVNERVVIFDGAFGTGVQEKNLTADDFGGAELEGCNEMLVLTRPDVIKELHANYLEVGVDVLETCTFGAFGSPSTSTASPTRPTSINVTAAQHRQRGGRRLLDARQAPLRVGLDGPGHQVADARARSASPSSATSTRSRCAACSTAASTCSSWRPTSTCSASRRR